MDDWEKTTDCFRQVHKILRCIGSNDFLRIFYKENKKFKIVIIISSTNLCTPFTIVRHILPSMKKRRYTFIGFIIQLSQNKNRRVNQ